MRAVIKGKHRDGCAFEPSSLAKNRWCSTPTHLYGTSDDPTEEGWVPWLRFECNDMACEDIFLFVNAKEMLQEMDTACCNGGG